MKIIAIEGSSHAGKSTFIKAYSEVHKKIKISHIPDYVEELNKKEYIPSGNFKSVNKQLAITKFFLDIEVQRIAKYKDVFTQNDLVFLDRSFFTLIAHNYAIEKSIGCEIYNETLNLVNNSRKIIPDRVVFINTPYVELQKRYSSDLPISELWKREFNFYLKDFYFSDFKNFNIDIDFIDGTQATEEMIKQFDKLIFI